MKIRTCSKCGETKELNEKNFCPSKRYAEGLTRICRDCGNTYRAKWAKMDRSEDIETYHNRELVRDMKKYGISVDIYRDKLIEQTGRCALCYHLNRTQGTIQRLTVDHDHACCDLHTKSCGKCVRGLLCSECNLDLAYLEKFLAQAQVYTLIAHANTWLHRATVYLRKWRAIHKEKQCSNDFITSSPELRDALLLGRTGPCADSGTDTKDITNQ